MPEQLHTQSETEQAFQMRSAELEAYAMKPEMAVIADERDAAPRKADEYVPGEDGQLHVISGQPDLTPQQEAEHSARLKYANMDADRATEYDNRQHDTSLEVDERVVARGLLHQLTSPNRQARPVEQIKAVAKTGEIN